MRSYLYALSALAFALVAAGCSSVTCGDGTVLQDGQCVPESTFGKCAPGTKAVGGECKPICAAGLAAGTNGCVLAESACDDGTELKDGKCVPADLMKLATDLEAPEPNDSAATAKRFLLPAVGAEPAVVGGIVEATQNGDADFDAFAFSVTDLTRIEVNAVAVGVPSVGVVVERAEGPGITRIVASLDSRGAKRQLILPAAGDYVLKVTEATNLFPGGKPRGAANFSYIVKVSQLAAPATKQIASDLSAAGLWTDGDLLEITGSGDTQIFEVALTTEGDSPFSGLRGLWAVDAQGRTVLAAQDSLSTDGDLTQMETPRLVVPPTGVRLLVDPVIAYGPGAASQRYGIKLNPIQVRDVTGTSISGDLGEDGVHIYGVDVEDGAVLKAEIVDVGWDLEVRVALYDATFALIGSSESSYRDAVGLVQPGRGGRAYVVIEDRYPSEYDTDMEYDIKLTAEQVTIVQRLEVPGTASASADVPASGAAWFMLSAAKAGLARVGVTAAGGGTFTVQRFSEKFEAAGGSVNATNGSAVLDRVPLAPGRAVLVRVSGGSGQVTLDAESRVPTYVAESEPNDQADAAQSVTLAADGTASLQGRIKDADVDLFRIDIAEPGATRLAAETDAGIDGSAPDTNLRILDESGREIDSNDDVDSRNSNYFSFVEGTNLAAGTYYVEVKYPSYAAGGKGDKGYTLYISVTQ